jgi:hypothetical protein
MCTRLTSFALPLADVITPPANSIGSEPGGSTPASMITAAIIFLSLGVS